MYAKYQAKIPSTSVLRVWEHTDTHGKTHYAINNIDKSHFKVPLSFLYVIFIYRRLKSNTKVNVTYRNSSKAKYFGIYQFYNSITLLKICFCKLCIAHRFLRKFDTISTPRCFLNTIIATFIVMRYFMLSG